MKIKANLILFCILTFFFFGKSGGLATFAWSQIMAAAVTYCTALALAPPAYATCIATFAAGCPIASWLSCFSKDTYVISQYGPKLLKNIQIGEKVVTKTLIGQDEWATVKQLFINQRDHEFIKISIGNKSLSLTPDHVLIVENKLIQAKDLAVGMKIENIQITKIQKLWTNTKITVITDTGTILANDILVTTICGDYLQAKGNSLQLLQKWKEDHSWLM